MSALVVGMILPWVIVGIGCWVGYQILLQNGRILRRLEALEEAIYELVGIYPGVDSAAAEGLPVGSAAPPFELPDLGGEKVSLEQFGGQRVLLMFFSPQCSYCVQMAPALAEVPLDGRDGLPVPLIMTSGGQEENRRFIQEHGIRCKVLLQEQREVAEAYKANGTPVGYLIDEQGNTASALAIGAAQILDLIKPPNTAPHNGDGQAVVPLPVSFVSVSKRPLSESRINRDGLKAGTPAPNFRLPRLEGGEVSLEDYRSQRLLLIFSDPECRPCDLLAPELERFHRRVSDPKILMISRGSVKANRDKVAEHGLTFPVLLQRQWEISRLYGKFVTPLGYLIDEQGVIAEAPADGRDQIHALTSRMASQA